MFPGLSVPQGTGASFLYMAKGKGSLDFEEGKLWEDEDLQVWMNGN